MSPTIVNHNISGWGDGIGDGKDMMDFPYKPYVSKTDKLLIMSADGTVRYTDAYGLTVAENANWGHSGAAIAGFSPLLPYAVTAGVEHNLTTDKLGLLMEQPDADPNFRWDVATQRFYSDVSITGGATYFVRAVIGFQLDTPKKGESIFMDTNIFTTSATGTPADAHIVVSTKAVAIPDSGQHDLSFDVQFYADSNTFTNGVGFTFKSSSAGAVSKHSIYIQRSR